MIISTSWHGTVPYLPYFSRTTTRSEEALKEAGRIKVEKIEAMKAKLNNTGLLFLEEGEVVINNRDDDGTTKLPGCASTHLLDNELIGLYFSAHWQVYTSLTVYFPHMFNSFACYKLIYIYILYIYTYIHVQ